MSPRELLVARLAIAAMGLHVVVALLVPTVPGWSMFAEVDDGRIEVTDRTGRPADVRACLPRDAMVVGGGPMLLRVVVWLGRTRPEDAPYTGRVTWRGQEHGFRVRPGGELETWTSSSGGPTGSRSLTSEVSPPSSRGS